MNSRARIHAHHTPLLTIQEAFAETRFPRSPTQVAFRSLLRSLGTNLNLIHRLLTLLPTATTHAALEGLKLRLYEEVVTAATAVNTWARGIVGLVWLVVHWGHIEEVLEDAMLQAQEERGGVREELGSTLERLEALMREVAAEMALV